MASCGPARYTVAPSKRGRSLDALTYVNWLAVLVAAAVSFLIGGVWFSLLFGKAWVAALGRPTEEMGKPGPSMAMSFVTTLATSAGIALLIAKMPLLTPMGGLRLGLLFGIGIYALGMASDYAFTGWSRKLYWIQAGYHVVMLAVITTILAAWR